MYKNLNDYTSTTLDVRFNNTNQSYNVGKQVNASIPFTKHDIQLDVLTNEKQLIVYDRIIKHCIIKCPSGQVWNALDYKHHYKQFDQDKDYTIFNFSYIDQWEDGYYYIFVGASDVKNTFSNTPSQHGVQLLRTNVSQHYYFKKLIAGNGIKLLSDNDNVIIQASQHNYTTQAIQLNNHSVIDLKNGNLQLCYTLEDSNIVDLINSTYNFVFGSDSSNSSQSSSSYVDDNLQKQVTNVTILVFKPNETTLKYNNLQILQRYDIGWFAFTIRKLFGKLFISQPTRMITDFKI